LIEANDRIVAAIDMYEEAAESPDATKEIARGLAATQIDIPKSKGHESPDETEPLQTRKVHPDLQDLSFGPLGASSSKLPTPIKPSKLSDNYYDSGRNSLSDFSDYEYSGEEAHNAKIYSPPRRNVHISHDASANKIRPLPDSEEDPFADPFAD
jgi:LAS seventeen-binding protein 5